MDIATYVDELSTTNETDKQNQNEVLPIDKISKQPLYKRIRGYTKPLVHCPYRIRRKEKTGDVLMLDEIKNLTVIIIKIYFRYDEEEQQKISDEIINKLSEDDVIVKSNDGEIQIYCNTDLFPFEKYEILPFFISQDYDIILRASYNPIYDVVLPYSRVYRLVFDKKGIYSDGKSKFSYKVLTYEFIRGSYDSVINRSLKDVLKDLEIEGQIKQK
jgi:hypothetical protein